MITKQQLSQLDTDYESPRTGCFFLLMILTLIASLMAMMCIVVVTSIVYLADDEIQLLFEMPEVDARIFK